MSVKIRLQRKGRKKRPFYHIVVADARAPRDGRFIEKLGTYNPMTRPATIDIDRDKAYEWLMKGAQPTDTARAILRFKGIYYKKHLMRGVTKGAMSAEEAETKYLEWVEAKEAKIAERFSNWEQEKREFHAQVSGTPPVIKEEVTEEDAPEVEEETETIPPEDSTETETAQVTEEAEKTVSEEDSTEEAVAETENAQETGEAVAQTEAPEETEEENKESDKA